MLSLLYRRGGRNAFFVFLLAGFSLFLGFAPRPATVPAAFILAVLFSFALVYLMKGSLWLIRLTPDKKARVRRIAAYYAPILFLLVPLRLVHPIFPFVSSMACLVCVLMFIFFLSQKIRKKAGLSEVEVVKFWTAPFLLILILSILIILGLLSSLFRDFL